MALTKGMPVVIATNGRGVPVVVVADRGVPCTLVTAGQFGLPVVVVTQNGLPITYTP